MATASIERHREQILNDFQSITGMNIEDAIHYLDQYDWQLDIIIDAYYNQIDFKQKSIDKSSQSNEILPTFYSITDEQKLNSEPIYHERQHLMRCGLHSLNNLFQIPKLFTYQHLEYFVRQYDKRKFFNDYRTLFLGNYDIRILIRAINSLGFNVKQIDVYAQQSLYQLNWDELFGLLINLNRKHWFTIKNLNGIYYNLDSILRKPRSIGTKDDLIDYLIRLIHRNPMVYLFIVTKQNNERDISLV